MLEKVREGERRFVRARVQEGSYKRVCKKVRTSACARRFVRARVQEGSYKFSAEEVNVD